MACKRDVKGLRAGSTRADKAVDKAMNLACPLAGSGSWQQGAAAGVEPAGAGLQQDPGVAFYTPSGGQGSRQRGPGHPVPGGLSATVHDYQLNTTYCVFDATLT